MMRVFGALSPVVIGVEGKSNDHPKIHQVNGICNLTITNMTDRECSEAIMSFHSCGARGAQFQWPRSDQLNKTRHQHDLSGTTSEIRPGSQPENFFADSEEITLTTLVN